jgi:hypothetical protein
MTMTLVGILIIAAVDTGLIIFMLTRRNPTELQPRKD